MDWSEVNIIRGIKAGDKTAFKQLFIQYYVIILRFLERITGNPAQAEDTAQNIFLKVWEGRDRLDETKSIKAYLYVLAKNEAFNYLKKYKPSSINELASSIVSDIQTDRPVEYSETISRLETSVSQMPAQRQTIFRMSRYEYLSNKEIAEKLGLSVRTVEKHLELALKDLSGKVLRS